MAHTGYIFDYMSPPPPVGGTIQEGLGVVALLEEVCQQKWALRFQKPMPFQVDPLILWHMVVITRHELSTTAPAPCLTAVMLPAMMEAYSPSETVSS